MARDIPFALVYSSINQNTLEVVRCIIRVSVSCAFFCRKVFTSGVRPRIVVNATVGRGPFGCTGNVIRRKIKI